MLATTRTVIVDEIHAMVGAKRGVHLSLTLERLEALAGRQLTRVGLSATQKPSRRWPDSSSAHASLRSDGAADCTIIDSGHVRERRPAAGDSRPRRPRRDVREAGRNCMTGWRNS